MASVANHITDKGKSVSKAADKVTDKCTDADVVDNEDCGAAVSALAAECRIVSTNGRQLEDTDDDRDRTVANIVGAGIGAAALGTIGGTATYYNIKAANRKKFTEAEKEFMDNVGSHIYCFVGADEAGTYGDLIQLSLD